jgi:hypothetical protein
VTTFAARTTISELHLHIKSGGQIDGQMSFQSPVVWWYRGVNREVDLIFYFLLSYTYMCVGECACVRAIQRARRVTCGSVEESVAALAWKLALRYIPAPKLWYLSL